MFIFRITLNPILILKLQDSWYLCTENPGC